MVALLYRRHVLTQHMWILVDFGSSRHEGDNVCKLTAVFTGKILRDVFFIGNNQPIRKVVGTSPAEVRKLRSKREPQISNSRIQPCSITIPLSQKISLDFVGATKRILWAKV
jgi:hypothetical protein